MDAPEIDPESAWSPPSEIHAGALPQQPPGPLARPGFLRTIWRSMLFGARWGAIIGAVISIPLLTWNIALVAFSAGSGRGGPFLADVGPLAALAMVLLAPIRCLLGMTAGGAVFGAEAGIVIALLLRVLPASRAAALAAAARRPIRLFRRRGEAPPKPATPRRRRLIWLLLVGVTLGLIQVSALGTGIYFGRSIDHRLEAAIEAADRDDPNWRFDDLMAHREEVPDEENSAFVVTDALAMVPGDWPSAKAPLPGTPKPPPSAASLAYDRLIELPENVRLDNASASALGEDLETNEEAIRILRTVADYDRGRHELDLSPASPLEIPLLDAQESRDAARLLAADASIRAHNGDADGALDSCRAILGVARSIGDEPFIISQIVRVAINTHAAKTARRVIGQGEPSDEALARLQALMLDESRQPLLLHAMRGERATQSELIRRVRDGELSISALSNGDKANPDKPPLAITPWGRAMLDSQLAVGLEWLNEAVSIARRPPTERPARWEAWNAEFKRVKESRIAVAGAILPLLLLPALSSADVGISRGQTELRATAILIAAERHRLKAGRWPPSIEVIDREILSETPADELTGAPFRMEYRDGRLLVYSIGINRKDERGEFDKAKWKDGGPDDVGGSLWDVSLRKQPPAP